MEKDHIKYWYRQADCLFTLRALSLKMNVLANFCNITSNCHSHCYSNFCRFGAPFQHRLNTWVGQVKRVTQTKMFSPYPGCHEFKSALSEFFWSLNKVRMWWYNILGDKEGSISHLYGLILLLQGLFYSLLKLLHRKGQIMSPYPVTILLLRS